MNRHEIYQEKLKYIYAQFRRYNIDDDTQWAIGMLMGDEAFPSATPYCRAQEKISMRRGVQVQAWFAKRHLKDFISARLSGTNYESDKEEFKAHCRCMMAYLFLLNRYGLADKVYWYMERI